MITIAVQFKCDDHGPVIRLGLRAFGQLLGKNSIEMACLETCVLGT